MPFGILFAAMLAPAETNYRSPEGQAAATAYVAAIKCASDYADNSSFERDKIDGIAREAVEYCVAARDAAIKGMLEVMPDTKENLALDNVSAKMRIGADDRLIARLERGDYHTSEAYVDPIKAVTYPAERLVFCIRVAINRKLEGLYLGDTWSLGLKGQSDEQKATAFAELGQASCPASRAAYLVALNQAAQKGDRETRDTLEARFSLAAVQAIATKPYLSIVPN